MPRSAPTALRRAVALTLQAAPVRSVHVGCPVFTPSSTAAVAASASSSSSGCPVAHGRGTGSRTGEQFKNPYAGARAPTAAELKILASTVPVLAEHGVTLTTRFYHKIFNKYPHLRNIFNQAHQATGMQPKALADAVVRKTNRQYYRAHA
jgi:hypothetical protein